MAAGPRDIPPGRDTSADSSRSRRGGSRVGGRARGGRSVGEPRAGLEGLDSLEPLDATGPLRDASEPDLSDPPVPSAASGGFGADDLGRLDRLEPLGVIDDSLPGELDPLGTSAQLDDIAGGESFGELRPQRKLRIWQIAPIVALAVGGSLMFAFPLAFESGETGPVVAMLGLLLCCCAAGWGLAAARRIGQTWPGLPARGSGGRADWRYVAGYAALTVVLALLAVWRVARLR